MSHRDMHGRPPSETASDADSMHAGSAVVHQRLAELNEVKSLPAYMVRGSNGHLAPSCGWNLSKAALEREFKRRGCVWYPGMAIVKVEIREVDERRGRT